MILTEIRCVSQVENGGGAYVGGRGGRSRGYRGGRGGYRRPRGGAEGGDELGGDQAGYQQDNAGGGYQEAGGYRGHRGRSFRGRRRAAAKSVSTRISNRVSFFTRT